MVNKHGADALRLYLINSPVVRAEPLRFREEGVFGVVKDVFLPWYARGRERKKKEGRESGSARFPLIFFQPAAPPALSL